MKPTRILWKLGRTAERRAISLRSLIDQLSPPVSSESDRVLTYVVLESVNCWASFVRAYYLSCFISARRKTGSPIVLAQSSLRTFQDAIDFFIRTMKPSLGPPSPGKVWQRRHEPAWHDPNVLTTLLSKLGSSDIAQLLSAFSYPTQAFRDLPSFRNFFAHRNEETATKAATVARSYGINPRLRPIEILCSRAYGRPRNLLSDWLDDIRNVVGLLCN